MKLSEEELKEEWKNLGEQKVWYCEQCDAILSMETFPECSGKDPYLPVEEHTPHATIKAEKEMTFEQFCQVMNRWFEPAKKPKSKENNKENKDA